MQARKFDNILDGDAGIGYCRYCGNSMIVADSAADADLYATTHCTCEASVKARARMDTLSNAREAFDGDEHFTALEADERAAMDALTGWVYDGVIDSAAVQIGRDKFVLKLDGDTVVIKRERKFVRETRA